MLLLLGLYGAAQSRHLNPAKVVREIEALEGLGPKSALKPATEFTRGKWLRGLWHQHHLQDGLASMALNLRKGMEKNGIPWLAQQIREAEQSGEERFLTEEDCKRIAHDAVVGNWERLAASSALTGEWLVFAKHMGQNYYLCLGTHDAGDEMLRKQIDAICLVEFPFLSQVLT
jgi:hypothetical protein